MEKTSIGLKATPVPGGFPSDLIAPDKKGKMWCLKYMKAFHSEHTTGAGRIMRNAAAQYEKWRAYANGRQPIDQYKDMMGIREVDGKRKQSWRNLDWNILPVVPKFKEILINKLLERKKKFKIRAIDMYSVNKERQERNKIMQYMIDQKDLQQWQQQTGVEIQSPIEPGMPVPQNERQLDLYMDIFPKQREALELYDELALCFSVNDWEQIEKEIATDIVEVGIAGTRTYIDSNGYIKIRRVDVSRAICNGVEKPDFSDLIRVGEYVPMTISELRQMAPAGTFTEKDLAILAAKSSGRAYNYSPSVTTVNNSAILSYPYDHERVNTLWGQWFSADHWAHVSIKRPGEGTKVEKKDNPFWLQKKGYTDGSYTDFWKTQGEDRTIVRNEIRNVYQAVWVVDTDYVFNYGLKTNMPRAAKSLADTKLDYNFYTLNFDSPMRLVEPIADNVQLNWLQFQHHVANSKPDGILISKEAIGTVTIGGKGGLVLEADDLLRLYHEKGSYVYKGMDASGRPLPFKPIEAIKNGMSDAAERHFQMIIQGIGLIRDVLGLNEITSASTPNPDTGKAVAEQAVEASDIALKSMKYAHHRIYENTGKTVAMLVPDARKLGRNPGWIEALGEESQKYWEGNADLTFTDFSLVLEEAFNEDQKKMVMDAATASLKGSGNGFLLPQDIYLIQQEDNPDRAYLLLDAKSRQRQEEEHQRAISLQEQNAQVQLQANSQLEKQKQDTIQMTEQFKDAEMQRTMAIETHKFQLKSIQTKLEAGIALDENDKLLYGELMKISAQGRIDLAKQQLANQAKIKTAAKSKAA